MYMIKFSFFPLILTSRLFLVWWYYSAAVFRSRSIIILFFVKSYSASVYIVYRLISGNWYKIEYSFVTYKQAQIYIFAYDLYSYLLLRGFFFSASRALCGGLYAYIVSYSYALTVYAGAPFPCPRQDWRRFIWSDLSIRKGHKNIS